MVKLQDVFALLESNFEYLLVVDKQERIIHASPLLTHRSGTDGKLVGRNLESLVAPDSLQSIRSGMALAREQIGSMVVFTLAGDDVDSVPLRSGLLETSRRGVYLFFGAQVDGLSRLAEEDKDERIKELACLYAVAEWIESSRSIKEFFTRLPDYLRRGMHYPDSAVVHSFYQGVEYGQKLEGTNYLRTKLVINQQVAGEIRVGYFDEKLALLQEEQRMLDGIGHMLSLALERKELAARLSLKQEEETASRRRLSELQQTIAARTREFDEQHTKLEKINTYLDRVNRDWEESKAWLEAVLKGIPDRVALIDRQRNLVMTNQDSVLPGEKCHKRLFNRDEPCRNCRLARMTRDRTPITLTIEHEQKFFAVHALPIFNKEHEVDGIMEFYRDITLERTYEQQLRQADRMASLGQLVSGIGHEINNPNQFIRGNIKILRQALEDILPIADDYHEQHPDLKVARLPYDFFRNHIMTLVNDMAHGSERIKGIVEGLRRFARRDDGLLIDQVDVNTLIEACTRLVHNEVQKHAEITLDLDPHVPSFAGNSQKIEQVLVNLIVNASHAMPDDRRGLITLRTRTADKSLIIEVIDNGKGMNEKTVKQIFDPFFTTKRARGGTGLGLAIAYRIIQEHSGTISVKSTIGEGTTFTVQIPCAPDESTEDQEATDK